MNFLFQIVQFLKPFPACGSWAYSIQLWWYDRQNGVVTGDENIEPSEEADSNGSSEGDILDSPTYLRRGLRVTDIIFDEWPVEGKPSKPQSSNNGTGHRSD